MSRVTKIVPAAALVLLLGHAAPAPAAHTQLTWYQSDDNDGDGPVVSFAYGSLGDTPVAANWDEADDEETVGVVRPLANGHWRWLLKDANSPGVTTYDFEYGNWELGDVPVTGLWGPSSTHGVGVARPLDSGHWEWHLKLNIAPGLSEIAPFTYGNWELGDYPISGDWEGAEAGNPPGAGDSSIGVTRPLSNGHWRWLLRNTNNSGVADEDFEYGNWELGDIPLPGNWDGLHDTQGQDATTPGVVRPLSNGHFKWYLKNVNAAGGPDPDPVPFEFGNWTSGDVPIMADWDGSELVEEANTGQTAGVVRPPQ